MNELPLRDIHLPEAVSAWPPAIGWWLLPILLLAIAFSAYQLYKYKINYKAKPAYKKIALSELKTIQIDYADKNQSIEQLRAISTLLRRIALSYLPRESVASLTGDLWIEQLNKLSQDTFFSNDLATLLASAPYQAYAEFNQDDLINICEQWINQLPEQPHREIHTQ